MLTQEQIDKINSQCPYEQGIFIQPYGIPTDIKELVVYGRYETGGITGGSCWGTERHYYTEDAPKDRMKVLDLVLKELKPNITFLEYREISELIHDNSERDEGDYYGNCKDWKIEYIILSELYNLLATWEEEK
jgi:hypothetical protein